MIEAEITNLKETDDMFPEIKLDKQGQSLLREVANALGDANFLLNYVNFSTNEQKEAVIYIKNVLEKVKSLLQTK